ncbi:hypothetical protein IAQ67_28845 (plasmid) [Paenibacillus peoriae]|uniref:Protein RecA n=1 Tax=Paenibacillus peoriae TaxID=59893 RepID=A0A7H0YH08_9BACL|nr:hypothetical protein [Paenibacillus peoriae]QNR70366.1 hypothetical protein IAQ67_28845 [Paenibacillus peoriae]
MAKRALSLEVDIPVGDLSAEILADFKKSFKDDSVTSYRNAKSDEVKTWYSCGTLGLNIALGGGLAGGQSSMWYGPKSAGKSTTAYAAVAAAQQQFPERIHIIADAENSAIDAEEHMVKLGVEVDNPNLIIIKKPEGKPLYAEDIFERLEVIFRNPKLKRRLGLVVIDSIGVLVSKHEGEKDNKWEKAARVGGIVSAINMFIRSVVSSGLLFESDAHLMFLNQIRDNIGDMWNPYRTPGGKMLEHACAQMVESSRTMGSDFHNKNYKEGNPLESRFVGQKIKYKVTKNKVGGKEGATANVDYYYEDGLDLYADVISLAGHVGLMEGAAWKSLVDPTTGEIIARYQGTEKWKEALHADDLLWAKLYTMTQMAARGATSEEIMGAVAELEAGQPFDDLDKIVGETLGDTTETE